MQNDRWSETRKNLEQIHQKKGTVYTLGLLMGIICRLSQTDYQLYQEIQIRAERAKNDNWINTASLVRNSLVYWTTSIYNCCWSPNRQTIQWDCHLQDLQQSRSNRRIIPTQSRPTSIKAPLWWLTICTKTIAYAQIGIYMVNDTLCWRTIVWWLSHAAERSYRNGSHTCGWIPEEFPQ
jgi:hypothetical protein